MIEDEEFGAAMRQVTERFSDLVTMHQELRSAIKEQAAESKVNMEKLRDTNHETNKYIHQINYNMVELKKDVTQINGDVVDIKRKQSLDNERAHARVDKLEEKNETRFQNIERDINGIKPTANLMKNIGAAIVKWLVPLLLGGSFISAVLYVIKVKPT